MDTDDLTLDRLILWYRERAAVCQKYINSAKTTFNRRKWKGHLDKNEVTAAFLGELAERRRDEDSEES